MKKFRRILSVLTAAAMLAVSCIPVFAAEGRFSDVPEGAWYAGAVNYVGENGYMDALRGTEFAPGTDADRAAIATALYRAAGSPSVTGNVTFSDVAAGAGYADAVRWAAANGVMSGYNENVFGVNDPVRREQIAAVLWRYAGSPSAEAGQDFADENEIAAYAATAVDWARANGIISGLADGRFHPKGMATRAEVAAILQNFVTKYNAASSAPDVPAGESRILVAYFSATGSTEAVAEAIAEDLGADTYVITPQEPYTSDDLDWTEEGSRVNTEHNDPAFRPAIAGSLPDLGGYDTVFIGYPIWWGEAPNIVWNFAENIDLTGKTVIPFCTSSSSGLGASGETLERLAKGGEWQDGRRFPSRVSRSEVDEWVDSLELSAAAQGTVPAEPEAGRTLVVYFSMPETADAENMTTEEDNSVVVKNGQVLGNTQYMAQVIAETAGADLFRIEPETPYPTDHTTLVDIASEEQDTDARPAIKGRVENIEQYDTIFVGYPIWWSDMPMILYTFFDTYDFGGKTLIPFSTHGGSSFAGTPSTIARLEPEAEMRDGLTISRNHIEDAGQEIVSWVNSLGIR